MMNRGVMDRQMFRNGGDVKMQQGDILRDRGLKPTQMDILMNQGLMPTLSDNAALQASIAAFMDQYGRSPTREEIAQIADAQRMMMQEGATGPSTMSPDGPGPEGYDYLPPQILGPMVGETVYGPRPTDQRPEYVPPIRLDQQFFQDMMPPQGESYYPPEVRDEGSGYADGGMVMPSDMASMAQQMPAAAAAMTPPEQEVVMGAMQASGGPEVQQMIASEAQSYGDPETAQSYEEMMNMVRGDTATVEERRSELAMLVGEEDAMQTPESVLALVQPIVQLSLVEETMAPGDNVDAGVGALAAQEMTTPVQGDMAGGVMTLAGGAEPQMQGMA